MDMWGRSLLVSVGLLVVLLPGCSAGRRSVQHREIRKEVHSIHSDSMLLKNLYQASRNKVIDIEHIVFDSCRLNGVQSVTHVAIKEQGEEVVESVVSSGSVDEKLAACHFKLLEYIKLFSAIRYKTVYIFVLNDWFKRPEYRDILDYINFMGCFYFFNEIPLNFLGL